MGKFNLFIKLQKKDGESSEIFRAYSVSEAFIINALDKFAGLYGGALLDIMVCPADKEFENGSE